MSDYPFDGVFLSDTRSCKDGKHSGDDPKHISSVVSERWIFASDFVFLHVLDKCTQPIRLYTHPTHFAFAILCDKKKKD